MIPAVLIIVALELVALFLLLRYERFAERDAEHGALTEPLLRGVWRGLCNDLRRGGR